MAESGKSEECTFELLQNWDDPDSPLAPLDEDQRDAIIELSALSSERPFPKQLDDANKDPCSPSLSISEPESVKDHAPIESTQQFFHWFSELEQDMTAEEDFIYQSYIQQLKTYQQQCADLLSQVETSLDQMQVLSSDYTTVSTKTNSLHEACETLLAHQTKMSQQADLIENKVSYFLQLEKVQQRLEAPTFSVTNEAFVPLLAKIDECIQYMLANPTYKDAAAYLARYRHCQYRALSMIRSYVTASLEQAAAAAQGATTAPLPATDGTTDPGLALVYGRFRTNAARVKQLMEEIEDRVDDQADYQQLLSDCHQSYFQQRRTLVTPAVQSAIRELAHKHQRDHCALVRSGCAFLVHMCEDEYQLFFQFFTKPSPELNAFLEALCWNLYDVLRPLIIHINHLETLAELCSILNVEMIEEHVNNNPTQLAAFGTTVYQLLQDVQERLVYRSHVYIRSDILHFRPAPGDLAYPDKLAMMQKIAASLERQDSRSSTSSRLSQSSLLNGTPQRSRTGNSPADLHGMWYPTVRRTLVCLSKLYRCLDRGVFQGLSQEALAMCVQSLQAAATQIAQNKTDRDAQLFEIKHLLILREQIAPFQVDFSVREVSLDLSKIKTAALGLVQRRSQVFALNSSNALLEFLLEGTPAVQEHTLDSKRDVDLRLKAVCEAFIRSCQQRTLQPLTSQIMRVDAILESAPEQRLPAAETLAAAVSETQRLMKTHLPQLQDSMQLYLANPETEFILFKPIKVSILQRFQRLHDLLLQHYSDEDRLIVMCPSQEQLTLLIANCMQPADEEEEDSAQDSSQVKERETGGVSVPSGVKEMNPASGEVVGDVRSAEQKAVLQPEHAVGENGNGTDGPVNGVGESHVTTAADMVTVAENVLPMPAGAEMV